MNNKLRWHFNTVLVDIEKIFASLNQTYNKKADLPNLCLAIVLNESGERRNFLMVLKTSSVLRTFDY
jgi:hypothetical protein